MRLFTTVAALRCYLDLHRLSGLEVGLVPTMGALHAGHLSLIQRARRENAITIVSIFVNPLQFGPTEDFQKYPRTLDLDAHLCEQAGVDAIFAPTPKEMGLGTREDLSQSLVTTVVPPAAMTSVLCGLTRTGHFQGVATIVVKLLNAVQPDRAYFGQKDAQQLAIVKQVVGYLNMQVEIVPSPIVREASGLAYSSRNQYLTPTEKAQAAVLYRSLQQAQKAFKAGDRTRLGLIAAVKAELATEPAIELEYVEVVDPVTVQPLEKVEEAGLVAIAVRIGTTRLIDNIILRQRKPIIAIDGPAGAGKSTVARGVAKALGLLYLDTGAMYRAVTWLVMQSGISIDDEPAIAELVSKCDIALSAKDEKVTTLINGQDVTRAIRSAEVTANVSAVAAHARVRRLLVKQQQKYGNFGGIVVEGRDIGTHVFPDAEVKIFLTASSGERARRRQQDLINQGQGEISLEQLKYEIEERDRKDSTRAIAPLRKASDAIEIQTDGMGVAEVIDRLVKIAMPILIPSHP